VRCFVSVRLIESVDESGSLSNFQHSNQVYCKRGEAENSKENNIFLSVIVIVRYAGGDSSRGLDIRDDEEW